MSGPRALKSEEIREIGETIFGATWQGDMARALGVPRQSVGYYLKAGGANGAQAAAILGLVARIILAETAAGHDRHRVHVARLDALTSLLRRFDGAVIISAATGGDGA